MQIVPQFQNITSLVINDPALYTPRVWKARETTIEKAKTLWQDGYGCSLVGFHAPGVYNVIRPAGSVKLDSKTGQIIESYVVDTKTATCNCEGFERMQGLCKHLLAVQALMAYCHNFMAPLYAEALGHSQKRSAAITLPQPALPTCPMCSSSHLIPINDFPGSVVCGKCTHIIEPEAEALSAPPEIRRWDCPRPKSVIHPSDFD